MLLLRLWLHLVLHNLKLYNKTNGTTWNDRTKCRRSLLKEKNFNDIIKNIFLLFQKTELILLKLVQIICYLSLRHKAWQEITAAKLWNSKMTNKLPQRVLKTHSEHTTSGLRDCLMDVSVFRVQNPQNHVLCRISMGKQNRKYILCKFLKIPFLQFPFRSFA